MGAIEQHFKELIAAAEEADSLEVLVPRSQLQGLMDQLEIKSATTSEEVMDRMTSAIERWEMASSRQNEAITRLIEQNRVLQRRVAEAQTGRPE